MSNKIKFGTAGWRGIISDDFTFHNVRIVSQAISEYLLEREDSRKRGVVAGYDTRFLSEDFAKASAEVIAANGIKVEFSKADVPTPAISYYIIKHGLSGGINITASHNPPEYSGIKFSPDWGGPAIPEITNVIEEKCEKLQQNPERIRRIEFSEGIEKGIIREADLEKEYNERIKEIIDTKAVDEISVAYDAMYGTARNYIPHLIKNAKIINNKRNVLFGGHRPEPAEEYLSQLKEMVVSGGADIGLATDGDADRFGIIDSDGSFITPNMIIGLALYHLIKKGYKGVAVRSVMTSSFIDAVAHEYGVEVIETPVGFKFIGDVFIKRDIIVGGEESGGLTVGGHVPEKDGILACLLMAELRASEKKPLKDILEFLFNKVGRFETVRKNYTLSEQKMSQLREMLNAVKLTAIGDFKIKEVITIDGYKFLFEEPNSWLGLRFSGTEPVVRVYVESTGNDKLNEIIRGAEEVFELDPSLSD